MLIGVDGGADALIEYGYIPDIIIGDMDSVSDHALKVCKDIVSPCYSDGEHRIVESKSNRPSGRDFISRGLAKI